MPTYRGSKSSLLATLHSLPALLAGRLPDPMRLGELFLTVLGNRVLDLIQSDFRVKMSGGVGSDGIRWKELAEATLERRRAKGIEGEEILRETGELYGSLTPGMSDSPDEARPAGQVFDIQPGSITVGASGTKADVHQHGAGHVPARPIVPEGDIPSGWIAEVDAAIERAIQKVVERICELSG